MTLCFSIRLFFRLQACWIHPQNRLSPTRAYVFILISTSSNDYVLLNALVFSASGLSKPPSKTAKSIEGLRLIFISTLSNNFVLLNTLVFSASGLSKPPPKTTKSKSHIDKYIDRLTCCFSLLVRSTLKRNQVHWEHSETRTWLI